MNLDNKEDLRLVDHLNKCRCCFEKFNYNEKQIKITDIIKEQFLELTQIELKSSSSYSKSVCLKCTRELQSISNFRLDLKTKQQRLYNFVTTSKYEIQDVVKFEPVNIKIETQSLDEFDNIFKFESQYEEIEKSEVSVSEADYQSPRKRYSSHQPKNIEPKDEIKVQKKALTKIKSKVRNFQPKVLKVKTRGQQKLLITATTCPHCGKRMSDAHSLSKHIRCVHSKEKNLFCDLCDFCSISKNAIVKHMPTHLPLKVRVKLSCEQCEYVTMSTQLLKKHVKNYHRTEKSKNHICSICEKVYIYAYHLEKHMQNHNNNQVKTTVKKKQTAIKQICPHCGIMVGHAGTLSKHIRRIHLQEKNFFCDLCDFCSISKGSIARHMLTHLPKLFREKLHCSKCEFVTISPEGMKKHVKRNCNEIKEKVECVCFCGKVFNCKNKLNYHITYTHQRKKNHICTVCQKTYSSRSKLKDHMESHSGKIKKREIACEVCGKMYMTIKHLRIHSMFHRDPQYVCDFDGCTKKFFKPNRLESHKKTHIDQRDFACHLCDKKYYDNTTLNLHISSVHEQLKYICEVPGCSSTHSRKDYCRNHALSKHKDLPEDTLQQLLKRIREMKPIYIETK